MSVHTPDLRGGRRHPLRNDPVGDAQLAQRSDCVRCEPEAEADLPRYGGALEDADVPPRAPQRQAGCQPADVGADDERERHISDVSSGRANCRVEIIDAYDAAEASAGTHSP